MQVVFLYKEQFIKTLNANFWVSLFCVDLLDYTLLYRLYVSN